MQWGYSPKEEKYIPLADFSAEKYLVTCLQAFEDLGWSIGHISPTSIVAYTPLSWQSYSEEVSVQISAGFAIVKSECLGIQMLFTDYGKNQKNLEDFFHEFDYVEYHLKDIWDERIAEFRGISARADGDYYDYSPLAAKKRIKNVFYLVVPAKGYYVTPVLILLNILYFVFCLTIFGAVAVKIKSGVVPFNPDFAKELYYMMGVNNRNLTLSGQYWRLISNLFIHFSFAHVFFNMYALAYIGLMTENKADSSRFLATYVLSGIVGGALSLVYHPVGIMAGASGAIMGMFGLFLALLLTDIYEKSARNALAISTILVIALMLLNGIFGATDNSAHIGGLVSGFVIGLVFTFRPSGQNGRSVVFSFVTAITIVAVFVGNILYYTPNYQIEKFESLVKSYEWNQRTAQRIYRYSSGIRRAETLENIRINGLQSWQNNVKTSSEMLQLTLPVAASRRAERMHRFSRLQLKMVSLLYKECRDNTTKYRPQIITLHKKINDILMEQQSESH